MKILINHLTRMAEGFVCVAGIDLETKRHVRPTLVGRLSKNLLLAHGGPFEIAAVVDLGTTAWCLKKPETEDQQFMLNAVKHDRLASPGEFWGALQEVARASLSELFGPDLLMRGPKSCGVDENKGSASLGVLKTTKSNLEIRPGVGGKKQIRLNLTDGTMALNLGVTDIRFYGSDHITPDTTAIAHAAKLLADGEEYLLSVGLTRAMATQGFSPVHWLQVNNIHFKTRPAWRLGERL